MTEIMKEFFTNFTDKTIAATVIAAVTILLTGCFKLIPKLKNMENKDLRKFLYSIISFGISSVLSVAYYLIVTKGTWNYDMLVFIGLALGEVKILYPLYENYGARLLVTKIGSLLVPSKKKEIEQAVNKISEVPETLSSEEVAKKQQKSEETGWLE